MAQLLYRQRTSDMALFEPMMVKFTDAFKHYSASMSSFCASPYESIIATLVSQVNIHHNGTTEWGAVVSQVYVINLSVIAVPGISFCILWSVYWDICWQHDPQSFLT